MELKHYVNGKNMNGNPQIKTFLIFLFLNIFPYLCIKMEKR